MASQNRLVQFFNRVTGRESEAAQAPAPAVANNGAGRRHRTTQSWSLRWDGYALSDSGTRCGASETDVKSPR